MTLIVLSINSLVEWSLNNANMCRIWTKAKWGRLQ
jgi:hypothetical protein